MEPADSDRYSLIVPEGGEQEQARMWFAPFRDAFSLLLVVRRFRVIYYIRYSNMKNIYIISIVVFIMLSCMASSPQHSLQSRLFGTWAASDDKVAVFQIDKDSLYYIDEDPIVAISYKFAGDSMSLDYWGNTIVQHISFRKDTLVMQNKLGEVSRFVPVK